MKIRNFSKGAALAHNERSDQSAALSKATQVHRETSFNAVSA
jgi:hypothetical protein